MNNKIFFDKKWNTRNYQQIDYSTKNFSGYCPLEGIQEVSKLSKQYFSKQNINKIQQGIQKQIYIKSNYKYKIGNQSENELIVIMRAMYFSTEHVRNAIVSKKRRRLMKLHFSKLLVLLLKHAQI